MPRQLRKLQAFPEMPDFCNYLQHIHYTYANFSYEGAQIKYLMIPLYINCVEIKCIAAAADGGNSIKEIQS